jgi:hypothetical protein
MTTTAPVLEFSPSPDAPHALEVRAWTPDRTHLYGTLIVEHVGDVVSVWSPSPVFIDGRRYWGRRNADRTVNVVNSRHMPAGERATATWTVLVDAIVAAYHATELTPERETAATEKGREETIETLAATRYRLNRQRALLADNPDDWSYQQSVALNTKHEARLLVALGLDPVAGDIAAQLHDDGWTGTASRLLDAARALATQEA